MSVSAASYNNFDHKEPYNQPTACPDLFHDSEEDDEDSLSTPLMALSPEQTYRDEDDKPSRAIFGRRKSVPHKSPAAVQDALQASLFDKSIVFQLDASLDDTTVSEDLKCTSKIICGQSLLTSLRKKVANARRSIEEPVLRVKRRKRVRTASIIEIPKSQRRRTSSSSDDSEYTASPVLVTPKAPRKWEDQHVEFNEDHQQTKPVRRQQNHGTSSGRPSRVKGPCQACQEPADGCMRKAFNWPFPTNQTFNDKGKPFVYLCNKCGLR